MQIAQLWMQRLHISSCLPHRNAAALTPGRMTQSSRHSLLRFRAPRYWPLLFGIGLLRCLSLLPYPALLRLGRAAGRILFIGLPRRRHIAAVNLKLCFPDLDDQARQRLLKAHFASLGIGIFEFALASWAGDQRCAKLTRFNGLEHLLGAVQDGKGIILLSGHFAGTELTGRALKLSVPHMAAMYRANKNPLINEVMWRARCRSIEELIGKKNSRRMIRLLRQGGVPVWYASDQSYRGSGAVLVPFFGVPAMSNPALTQLAKVGDAVVIPYLPRRLPGSRGYEVDILPPLNDFPGDDPTADILRIHRLLERHIRRAPEQYYWVHRRFKDRPPEYPDPYAEIAER